MLEPISILLGSHKAAQAKTPEPGGGEAETRRPNEAENISNI
jgi:hypothetical protein